MSQQTTRIPPDFDTTDPDLVQQRVPLQEFAQLRAQSPVWWNHQPPGYGFDDGGFWLLTRHADVREVSIKPELFSTWENGSIVRFHPGITRDQIEIQRLMMINVDPPDHTKLRRIVSRGFTPRAMRMLEEKLRDRAARIVAAAADAGKGDFVTQVASELPLQAIAELLGVPQEDRRRIFDWSNQMMAYDDPDYDVDPAVASAELIAYFQALAEDRAREPRDDIVTKLVTADVEDRGLTPDEFAFFVLLLSVAGNETTRNAITHGMMAFFEHPDQWELFKSSRPATTADEVIRWATPVMVFQRTALQDVTIGGVDIKTGQRIGLSYSAANNDPEVFDRPERFDITRDPNPQLGFGGGGPHFCLGANLARMEINLMFNALAEQVPGIAPDGPARRLRSGWLNAIKELPVRYA
jgi:cholest-4-en-3-one 26-monooxygenase